MNALRTLYDTYIKDLYQYGVILNQDPEKVKDCIHDLFISLWNSREKMAIPQSGKAYMMVSLRRRIFDKGSKIRSMTGDMEQLEENKMITMDDETKWIESENEALRNLKLETAINQLSERQKEIIYMKYYQEMEYEDIGRIMDLNYQSARNLVNRALSVLRKEMLFFVMLLLICQ